MATPSPDNISEPFHATGANGQPTEVVDARTVAAMQRRWESEDKKSRENLIEAAEGKVTEAQGAIFQTFMNVFMKGRADGAFMFQLIMQCYQLLKAGENMVKVKLATEAKENDGQAGFSIGNTIPRTAAPAGLHVGAHAPATP